MGFIAPLTTKSYYYTKIANKQSEEGVNQTSALAEVLCYVK